MSTAVPVKDEVPAIYRTVPGYGDPTAKNHDGVYKAILRRGFSFRVSDQAKPVEGPRVVAVDRPTAWLQRQKWDNYEQVMDYFGFPTRYEFDPVSLIEKMRERMKESLPKQKNPTVEAIEAMVPAMAEVFAVALDKAMSRLETKLMQQKPKTGPVPVAPPGPHPTGPQKP